MAKRVKEFSQNIRQRYPWHRWVDGNIWQIQAGRDFKIPMLSMRGVVHDYARRKGFSVTVHKADETTLEIQFKNA